MKTFGRWYRFSLGGLKVLVLYLQECFSWRTKRLQVAFGCVIVLTVFALVDWQHVAVSMPGAQLASAQVGGGSQYGLRCGVGAALWRAYQEG